MSLVLHRRTERGEFRLRKPLHAHLLGAKVHHEHDSEVVQEGGSEAGEHDRRVGDSEERTHDERRSAHDRRHEDSARAGRGFYGPCEIVRVADFLHERDRERSGRGHVRLRASGDRPHQAGGDDGDLRRAAAVSSRERHREVVEELARFCCGQERTEQDEHEDIGRRNGQRGAVDPLVGQRHADDDPLPVEAAVREEPGAIGAEPRIGQEQDAQDREREPDRTAARLRENGHGHDRDGQIHEQRLHIGVEKAVVDENEIGHAEQGEPRQDPVGDRWAFLRGAGERGVEQERDGHQRAEVDRVHLDRHHHAERIHPAVDERRRHGQKQREETDASGQRSRRDLLEWGYCLQQGL